MLGLYAIYKRVLIEKVKYKVPSNIESCRGEPLQLPMIQLPTTPYVHPRIRVRVRVINADNKVIEYRCSLRY